jgi:hypothetical protein
LVGRPGAEPESSSRRFCLSLGVERSKKGDVSVRLLLLVVVVFTRLSGYRFTVLSVEGSMTVVGRRCSPSRSKKGHGDNDEDAEYYCISRSFSEQLAHVGQMIGRLQMLEFSLDVGKRKAAPLMGPGVAA